MRMETIGTYDLGDMTAHYIMDAETRVPELMLYPSTKETDRVLWEDKRQNIDALIQLKILGDNYTGSFSGGVSMRQSESVFRMKYRRQREEIEGNTHTIRTICADDRGYEAVHTLVWQEGDRALTSSVTFTNHSALPVTLEMLASFSIGGITPFTAGDAYGDLYLHRVRSVWSMEGRLESRAFEDMQLEPSWAPGGAVRCERFGEVGSFPVNRYFPYAVIEDRRNNIFWGAQIAHNASWQMEVYRRDESASLSGGLADRELGHWMKEVKPEEAFTTPIAILTAGCDTNLDLISQRLTSWQSHALEEVPESERDLPILFNEYCTTWGCPSHRNIAKILDAIKGRGFAYFVIDAGWYKQDGHPWDQTIGDYIPSKSLFPEGLDRTVQAINDAGMKAGLWFEIDNVGRESKAYRMEDHLLRRDGKVLTTDGRRFWDLRQEWVGRYLSDTVIGLLKRCGFGYIKIDYNDTIGIGCDGDVSPGEGLRRNMEASYQFVEKIRQELPGIVIENCASGGHRLEPKMMGATSMASFSDAHECEEIPIIAANLHRVILPRQSQIWAVIRKTDTLKRIAYSIANTFLGRMCLSGDVTKLSKEQWDTIDGGMRFYKEIAGIIKEGTTHYFGHLGKSWRHPEGWQAILREGDGEAYALFHIFGGNLEDEIAVTWKSGRRYTIVSVYSDDDPAVTLEDNRLSYHPREHMKAVAVHLREV